MNCFFKEVSAKSGDNIQNLFNEITKKLVGQDENLEAINEDNNNQNEN